MGNIASATLNGITALPRLAVGAFTAEGFKRDFGGLATETGLKNMGEFLGKSALFGLSVGGGIAATALTGGLAGAAFIPGIVKSGIAVGGALKDFIESRSWTSDWNKTEDQVLSSDAGKVLQGVTAVSNFVGAASAAPKALQNIVNIANRGQAGASIGELARIVSPAVKNSVAAGNNIASAGHTISSMLSLNQSLPPTEIRQQLRVPGSLQAGQPFVPPSFNPFLSPAR